MRKLIAVAIAAILVSLASGSVNAQVKCDECYRVWMPVVRNAPVDVDAATRFWGG